MASLADAFLNDFDSDEEEVKENEVPALEAGGGAETGGERAASGVSADAEGEEEEEEEEDVVVKELDMDAEEEEEAVDTKGAGAGADAAGDAALLQAIMEASAKHRAAHARDPSASASGAAGSVAVSSLAGLANDPRLHAHTQTVDRLRQRLLGEGEGEEGAGVGAGLSLSQDEEYQLIVRSSEYSARIDQEMTLLHKVARDLYASRVKELEQIVVTPLEYARVVRRIGNATDLSAVDLSFLPQHLVLTITVTVTTTSGRPLPEAELASVLEACDTIVRLDDIKRRLYKYIESRMELTAPNLSAVVGPDVAAQLMGVAGGLVALSKMPSCNVQVIGVKRKTLGGFSSTSTLNHFGVVAACPLVSAAPNELKLKAVRLVSAKCALAARCDCFQEDASGGTGRRLRAEVEKRLEKLQEPPATRANKALPAPDDKPRKKRGGRRKRKQSELTRQTELGKQKNRMAFGVAEVTDDYSGQGMGMLGQSGIAAALRVQAKTKARAKQPSKQQQQKLKRIKTASSGTSGLASTIAFTPVQGMELVNPDANKDKVSRDTRQYFSHLAGFQSVVAQSQSTTPGLGLGLLKRPMPPVPKFIG